MFSEGEEESQICRRQEEEDEMRSTNARPTEKARGKERKPLQSLQLTKIKKPKPFSGSAFADDVAEEESDFKCMMQQAAKERGDFTKGLVQVKEFEAATERMRVEQDKVKLEHEEKRKDIQVPVTVPWASPTFDNLSDLEGAAMSRAPMPDNAFSTPNDRSISGCVGYYNHVFEQGLPLQVEESRLCKELCEYCFYLSLFID